MVSSRRRTPYGFNEALDLIELVHADRLGRTVGARPYAAFEPAEYARRYARLSVLMRAEGIDAALLTQEENVQYFSGYLSVLWISKFRPFVAVLPADPRAPATIVVSGNERGNAESTSWVENVRAYSPQAHPMGDIAQSIRDAIGDSGRVGIEIGFGQRLGMNIEQLYELEEALPGVTFVDITPLAQTVRMLKSETEIAFLREAARISTAGVTYGWQSLREGMTERELASAIGEEMYRQGAEVTTTKQSFFGVMSGERLALFNAVASDRTSFQTGDLIAVDGGATYRGYVADFIRHASIGPVDPPSLAWHTIAAEASQAAIDAVRPGVVASDVYDAAQAVFRAHGVERHNQSTIVGHGIGADVHELPWVGEAGTVYTSDVVIRKDMVFSIEPILGSADPADPYGHFIVEDMISVGDDGAELLTGGIGRSIWVAGVEESGLPEPSMLAL